MLAPILPNAEELAELLAYKVDYVIFDRMNYHYGDWVYRKYGLEEYLTEDYFSQTQRVLSSTFEQLGIRVQ